MGYWSEDASRDRADSRRQRYATGHDYAPGGSYAPGTEYASDGYAPGGYGEADAYASYEGDGQGYGYGYERNGSYGPGGQYGPGGEYEYGANGDYSQNYEYGYGEQPGYGQQGHGSSVSGYGDDNDWYGDQGPVTGGFAAVRDPVRGFPPAPGQFASPPQLPAPRQLEASPYTGQQEASPYTGQQEASPYTGQQEVYDDSRYEAYPGYEGVTETDVPQGYDDAPGYNSTQAYDTAGYDTADYDTAGYDTGQAGYDTGQAELFAAAPTYEDAVGYAPPQGYGDDFEGTRRGAGNGNRGGMPKRGRPGKAPKGGKRGVFRRILLSATGVVVLIAAAGAGYILFLKPKQSANDSATGPLPSPGATSSVTAACQAKFGAYCHIELRSDDPKPLTLTELYPAQFFNETDHISFAQVGTRLDKNCANAVIGPNLVSELQKGKCTQVLRASYVSGDHTIMGTIGVVNLDTTNGAHHAGKVVGANDFVSPLSAAHGPGSNLGKGTGVVQAEFKGHYLILTWAEFSTLKAPANTAQDTALEQFENDLIAGTANISLSQRMINGTAATSAG